VTPIEVWPAIKHTGRPGYSRRHFAALAGAPEDLLRVAERIGAALDAVVVADYAKNKLSAGEDVSAVLDWQTRALTRMADERWARLCASFGAVITTLESAPQTPAIKALVRQAKQAARRPS
jgi:hypothetical protein